MLGRILILVTSIATVSATAQELHVSHQFHAQDDSRGRAAQIFATEVARRSPELKIIIHPQLSMGFTRDEQVEALQTGTLDFTVLPFFVPSKQIPEFSVALLPGLVPDLAAARALKASVVHAKLQDIAAHNGLRIVTWWWMPGGFALAAPRALKPTSLSGLKFQSCGLMQNLLVAAGAQLGDEPTSEAPMLLDMGALDGLAVTYEEFVALRLHEHAMLGTFGGRSLVTCFTPMLMSKKTWDRLSQRQRQALEEAAAASDAYFANAQIEIEARVIEAFKTAGVEVRNLTDEELTDWLNLARETVWVRYREMSELSRELLHTASEVISQWWQ
jgi:TRAP-type transport system periplasmic protein